MSTHTLAYGDEDPLAKAIRSAIGAGDFERVQVTLPQFNRTDGITVARAPLSPQAFDALREVPSEWLKSLGLGLWDKDEKTEHWMYPHEWYDSIPDGYGIVDINGNSEKFKRGETDDDKRFGMLSFGFTRSVP